MNFYLYTVGYDWSSGEKTYTFIATMFLPSNSWDANELMAENFAASPNKLWAHADAPLADGQEFFVSKKALI